MHFLSMLRSSSFIMCLPFSLFVVICSSILRFSNTDLPSHFHTGSPPILLPPSSDQCNHGHRQGNPRHL
jgi:hypothetical protein